MTRFCFIVNPIAGNGRAPRVAAEAAETLRGAGLEVRVHQTSLAGEGRRRAAEWAEDADVVVAVGGDGTLSEVIGGIGARKPLGLVPSGTANVVARDLRIPLKPRKAAAVLAAGHVRRLDVGEANGRRFLAMVGVGFDGEIVRRLTARRDGPIRMRSYLRPMVQAVTRLREPPLRVTVDGEVLAERPHGLLITNTRNYGGIFEMVPQADSADGHLDLQGRLRAGRWSLLCWGLSGLLRRGLSPRRALYRRGRTFTVESEVPVAIQVDGDYLGTTPVEVTLLDEVVEIVAPSPASANGSKP